ncbi:MAG TPA: CHAT domain-containing protein [Paracoccaceae bacterium]|nr:CHAT domain-containing protein [Paracoccaceae bacterium]
MLRVLALALTLALPAAADDGPLMDEAFRVAQGAMASAAGEAIAQIGARAVARAAGLDDVLRTRQAAARRLQEVQTALARPDADRVRLTGEAEAFAAEIAAADARIGAAAGAGPAPLSLAEVQRLLAPDEALILIYSGQAQVFVWAVSSRAAGWHAVSATPELLSGVVDDLRATLDPTGAGLRAAVALEDSRPQGRGFPRRAAWLLYRYLLEPLEPVFGDVAHVYLVPDGALTALPFAVLPTAPPEGADDDPAALRATPWLIRRHALTVLPAVESLGVIHALPPPAPDRLAFAGYGDPAFGGALQVAALAQGPSLTRGGLADPGALSSLAPLPQTRPELLAIAASLGAPGGDVVLGADASEAAVKAADLSARRVLAFATHGLLSGELPGLEEPALALTPPEVPTALDDGLLTASEIADLRLDADWVILSACNTAGGAGAGGGGASGPGTGLPVRGGAGGSGVALAGARRCGGAADHGGLRPAGRWSRARQVRGAAPLDAGAHGGRA